MINKGWFKYCVLIVGSCSFFQVFGVDTRQKFDGKIAVFVLGTGRSGTSCLTGVLQILGVDLGNSLSKPSQHNEKGSFEDIEATQLHKSILAELGKSTRSIEYNLKLKHHQKYPEIKSKIKKLVEKKFRSKDLVGAKYPYIEWFLPVYIEVLEELGFTPYFIISLRHPKEIVDSFALNSTDFSREFYAIRNTATLMAILEHTVNHKVLVVHYDEVLNDTKKVIEKIYAFIPGLYEYSTIEATVYDFLDDSLKHQRETNLKLLQKLFNVLE